MRACVVGPDLVCGGRSIFTHSIQLVNTRTRALFVECQEWRKESGQRTGAAAAVAARASSDAHNPHRWGRASGVPTVTAAAYGVISPTARHDRGHGTVRIGQCVRHRYFGRRPPAHCERADAAAAAADACCYLRERLPTPPPPRTNVRPVPNRQTAGPFRLKNRIFTKT